VNQVSVRINKSREGHAPADVELLSLFRLTSRFDRAACSDRGDPAVAHQNSAIPYDPQLGKGSTAPRRTAAQSEEL